jgi:hypothetical protein
LLLHPSLAELVGQGQLDATEYRPGQLTSMVRDGDPTDLRLIGIKDNVEAM